MSVRHAGGKPAPGCSTPRWPRFHNGAWPPPTSAPSSPTRAWPAATFYFHFPTKEHVLVEVERAEETRIVSELGGATGDLVAVLNQLVQHVLSAEKRLGPAVFRDMLGLHFCSTRPVEDELAQHPLGQFLVGVIGRAQDAGQVSSDVDAAELATFFLTGLFALLATGAHDGALLSHYVTTIVKGMEKR